MDVARVADADPLAPVLRALARLEPASSDFDLNPGVILPAGRTLRPAAVLVAFQPGPAGVEVILTRRSSRLKHHPGQIAFPGGKPEPEDEGLAATALREAREEVGLDPARVEILGTLTPHETVTGFTVTPVLGRLHDRLEPVPEAGEVDEVFAVPLAHLADAHRYRVERRRWLGQWRNYYVVPWGPYYIWGATARILRGLAVRMAP
jgi:8-oxo-dGTP pyrophosphatase MutT (NUDIX family)